MQESPCSWKQVQENVVRLVILWTLWLCKVHMFHSSCTLSCTRWNMLWKDKVIRVRISSSHFTKCEGILSSCEALSQRNNINAKLSISFLAPAFHLVTMIFQRDNVLQKYTISWHCLILQPLHQANFLAVYLTSLMFYVLNFLYFSLTVFCITFK